MHNLHVIHLIKIWLGQDTFITSALAYLSFDHVHNIVVILLVVSGIVLNLVKSYKEYKK